MKKLISTIILSVLFLNVVCSQNYKFGKVSKEEIERTEYEQDKSANAVYLCKEKQIEYTYSNIDGWRQVTTVFERIKIFNNKKDLGVATHKVYLYRPSGSEKEKISSLKAISYNLNGNKIEKTKLKKSDVYEKKLNNNWVENVFTMPNVKAGTVIEWRYVVESPYANHINEIKLQEQIPIEVLNVEVAIPEFFIFRKHIKGYLPVDITEGRERKKISFTQSQTRDGLPTGARSKKEKVSYYKEYIDLVYKVNKQNVKALVKEPFVSNINNYSSALQMELTLTKFPNAVPRNYSNSWEGVSKTVYNHELFGSELKKDKYFKNEIEGLLQNISDDVEKMNAIFNFVKKKVVWNGQTGKYVFDGVKKAYNQGSGNVAEVNLILTSMLRFSGLNANPILISTRDNGVSLYPTVKGFNYVISSVILNDELFLLDATEKYSSSNNLPLRTLNWQGRMILEKGMSKWIDLTNSKLASKVTTLSAKIQPDLTVEGLLRVKRDNLEALMYRSNNNKLSNEGLIDKFESKYGIEVDYVKVKNKETIDKQYIESIKFKGDNLIEVINDKIYVSPLLFLQNEENVFKSDKREYPVDFGAPWVKANTINIQIPEGYKVEYLPKSIKIKANNKIGDFTQEISKTEKKIVVKSIEYIAFDIIPVNYYSDLKSFYNQIIDYQKDKIIFSKL